VDFSTFNLDSRVAAGVTALGYETPTPIQQQAIPPVLAGRDLIGLAQTGTGKTAAFVLPILQRLLDGPRGRVRALIIAPTRELAEQINDAVRDLGEKTRVRSTTIYGGVSMNNQVAKLRAGVEIVVACPGRLLDHIRERTINLSGLEVLVLDEADRMFDMGFLPDIRRILGHLPKQRQTLLFSATMPDDVRKLAHDILIKPITVQVAFEKPLETVAHALYPVAAHLKTALLLRLLAHTDTESVLVFTRTKHRARRVAQQLKTGGYAATALQGNLSQSQRQKAMAGFRDGSYQIMVATDIAARGLDIAQISHVINYDIPDTVDAYTHRIGRTGRAARTGDAFTLVTPEDNEMVRDIERALHSRLERRNLPDFDYAAVDMRPPAPPRPQFDRRSGAGGAPRGRRPVGQPASRAPRKPPVQPTPPAQHGRASRQPAQPQGARPALAGADTGSRRGRRRRG
jgi:ATP-dependent RNA helicase RhlE